MINKQKIYQLIDNKYNNYIIEISTDDLIYYNNMTENEYVILYNKYINLLYNALTYNYKKYKHNITKIDFSLHAYAYNNYDPITEQLSIIHNQLFNKQLYNYLNLNNNLYNLNLKGNILHDKELITLCTFIKNMPNLKILDLSYNSIEDISPLNEILKNNIIKKIDLSSNNITNLNLENLKTNSSLKELLLNYNNTYFHNSVININDLSNCLKGNNSIELLDLSGNRIHNDNFKIFFEAIKNNNSLKILKLTGNDVKSEYISEYLQNNKSCKKIYNDNSIFSAIESSMNDRYYLTDPEQKNYYKELLNKSNNIYHLEKIFKSLETNNTLNEIKFHYLNDIEYNSLCNMLKINTSINYLYLIDVPIKLSNYTHDFKELFNVLKYNSSIRELHIDIINMNKKEIKSLYEMIKFNTSLKKLTIKLNNNPLNNLYLIYKSLEFNNNIEEFEIIIYSSNVNYDLYPLCKSLYFNKSIKKIYIIGFNFKNTDLILDLLKYNHHIIDIKLNDLSDKYEHTDLNIFYNNIKFQKLNNFNKKLYYDINYI